MKRRFVHFSFWLVSFLSLFIFELAPGAPGDVPWVEDAVPAGAWTSAERGDQWLWVSSNPSPFSGSLAHQSTLAPGIHNHYFSGASAKLAVNPQDTLFTYVYLNPANPPREIMLLWFDGASWMHAAYWGENLIRWGVNGTASQRRIEGLPPLGEWVRLEVPASSVDLGGRTISGMHFVLYDGQATWDYSGKTTNAPLPVVSIWPFDATASEGNDGGGFLFLRSGDRSTELTVRLGISGTASNGLDYQTVSNSVTFPAGQGTVSVNILPINDRELESAETVMLRVLSDPAYTVSSTNRGTVTITDDDETPVVTVAVGPWTASEGAAQLGSPRYGVFTIQRTGDQSEPLTVYFTIGGTASNGADYEEIANSTTIIPNAAANQIFIVPVDDTEIEGTENVVITLVTNATYIVGSAKTASVNILDDDPNNKPTVTVQALPFSNASETDRRYAIFQFERSGGNVNEAFTAHFRYEGTAALNSDYESTRPDGYITFPPQVTGVQVYVTPIEDVEVEGTETITVRLLMPDDGTYRTGSSSAATVFLEDNDNTGLPTVEVYADDSTADEEQFEPPALPDWGGFRFVRSGGTSAELTVEFTVTGTASNGVDYERITNSITFPAGVFSAGFTIEPMDDALAEPPETVVVTLATNAAYTLGSRKSATVTILDDDGGPPRLLIRRESNGVVEIAVQGDVGRTYRLEGSMDLVNWTQVSNDQVMLSYPLVFTDADAPNHPRRFYRAIQMQ